MTGKHIIFIDLETGGLSPELFQITQIGAVAVERSDGLPRVDEPFECKIKLVQGKYTNEALEKQNYTTKAWEEEAVPVLDALDDLFRWVQPFTDERTSRAGNKYEAVDVAGHNVLFDAEFLNATSKRCGIRLPMALWTGGMLDTLQLAMWDSLKNGTEYPNYRLETLCRERGILMDEAHDALSDALAAMRLARSLMVGF
jgi:DNA polymerase III epsilon subunit-like protein